MAITTEVTHDIIISDLKVDEIGLSDTIDNYTDAEIAAYLYVAANSRMLGGNIDIYTNTAGSYDTWNEGMPYNTGAVTGSTMTMKSGDGIYESPADGRYLGVILLNSSNNIYNEYITVGNSNNYRIITDFDAPKFLMDVSATLTQIDSTGAVSWDDKSNSIYNPVFNSVHTEYKYGGSYVDISFPIVPYFVLEYDSYLYLIRAIDVNGTAKFMCGFGGGTRWNGGAVYYPLKLNALSQSISIAFNGYGFGDHIADISPDDFLWYYGQSGNYPKYSNSDNVFLIGTFSANSFKTEYAYISFNDCMMMYAASGMYFRLDNDIVYKPLIDSNVVYGFTDQLDAESDIDSYTGETKHDIPVAPPAPPVPEEDPWDGVDFGGSSGGGGAFAKFYYMTSTELANLRSWMNSNNVPEGFDPMAQIIGLSQLPVAISGSDSENVMFVNSAAIYTEGQNRVVDTGVATQRGLGRTIVFNLGSVEIPRRMQQRGEPYLDYSCAVELYLPFCGVFSLDTQAVMGRTITAQLVLDPTSGSVIAYAWVSESGQKLPVAYGSGQVGVDLPITAQQYGMSKAALSQANAAFSQSILQTAF